MYIDQKWDYPTMAVMDNAFETLAAGVQAEVGKAFVAAYSEHVSSIQLFAQVVSAEAELLRNNSNAMQQADDEIAAQVRSMFAV